LWFRDNARRKRLEAGVIQRYSPKKIAESKDRKRLRDVTRFARWAKNNAEHVKILRRESSLRFAEKNPHKVRATLAKRRAAKLLATPKFGQDGIEDVYLEAHYFQMEVDHIIPLVSDKVCGLHVIANLQLLSKSANSAKRNRFDPNDDYFLQ
jgi:5-methylcytosine-specific restriction endonuclease McrA